MHFPLVNGEAVGILSFVASIEIQQKPETPSQIGHIAISPCVGSSFGNQKAHPSKHTIGLSVARTCGHRSNSKRKTTNMEELIGASSFTCHQIQLGKPRPSWETTSKVLCQITTLAAPVGSLDTLFKDSQRSHHTFIHSFIYLILLH